MPHDDQSLAQALDLLTLQPGTPGLESLDESTQKVVLASRPWVFGKSVVGTGIGPKVTQGEPLDDLAVRVYVTDKYPMDLLSESERIPPEVELPGFAEPVLTDVVPTGPITLQSLIARVRPARPGYSTGLFAGTLVGTFGCLVRKRNDPAGKLYMLSNSHVLAGSGLAALGSNILQPGRKDGGSEPGDALAVLTESAPFDFNPGFNNLCDAAIAEIVTDDIESAIPSIGVPAGVRTQLSREMQIQKTGRTTGHTISIVKDLAFRTFISYPRPDGTGQASAGFRDQVLCEHYTANGDSGSLVCDMDGNAIGLHWCGSESVSIFSPIEFVCSALDIEIVQGGPVG
jgi:hypothetical protein